MSLEHTPKLYEEQSNAGQGDSAIITIIISDCKDIKCFTLNMYRTVTVSKLHTLSLIHI